jgi:hypothetical protein
MKKKIALIIFLIGFSGYAQTKMTDWNELSGDVALKSYVENQAYEFLNFKPIENDSVINNGVRISHGTNSKIIIRGQKLSYAPLIVINGYPIDEWTILNLTELKDVCEIILHKPSEETYRIYGLRGKSGLMFIKMNKRKFRKLRRKYGR